MGSRAPGYDPPVPSEQQPGVPHYPNPPEYDLQYIPMDRRTVSIAPGYDPPRSSEQQHGVSQYPNPPVYGRNSFLETNSLVGDDLQRTSSIMHHSSTEPSYSHLMSYSHLDGPHPAPSSRPGTGNISTQPYNPEAPSFDTNHASPFLRVSSSSLDESLPALNRAVSFPSYENELPRPYRQVRDDSMLLPRYAQSNLSNDSNEASCRSNMLYRSSFSRESFPRPSLPPLQLPSERQRGRTTTIDDRSLLAPRINTPSVSGRSHLVTTSLEGNIPQSRRAHDAVPWSGNSIPNSEQTQDSRRTDYGAYSPVDLYSGQDSERRNSDQQNRRKRSVFDRMVFPTTQEREQEDSATNSVGDDDDDDNQDDFSVSEIMTSLRQSSYRWLNEKTPAKFLNEIRNSGFQYQVGNKKIQIMTPETKSADDHLAVGVPVEDYGDALTTNEESPPFVDFKRRSSTMRKAHQVDAAKPTGNDNVLSAENKPSKRRKLIRPKFGDET
ncbi:unnamed protein product [Linum trigynum]|uniref:Uncharacterized protein n=1 Tax=Linum trigynum TaxID=586398 RepID=A0AAV2EHP6_9ROSI